jgi:hypothetical protein
MVSRARTPTVRWTTPALTSRDRSRAHGSARQARVLRHATAGFLLDAVSRVVDLNSASPNSVRRKFGCCTHAGLPTVERELPSRHPPRTLSRAMPALLDAELLALLVERVGFVLARLPASVEPETFFAEPDLHPEHLRDPALARALGWIEGLADAADLTVLELLDSAEIVIDALRSALPSPALVPHRDPKTGRFLGPTHVCRSCGRRRPHHRCRTGGPGCTHCDVCGEMLDPLGHRSLTTAR